MVLGVILCGTTICIVRPNQTENFEVWLHRQLIGGFGLSDTISDNRITGLYDSEIGTLHPRKPTASGTITNQRLGQPHNVEFLLFFRRIRVAVPLRSCALGFDCSG